MGRAPAARIGEVHVLEGEGRRERGGVRSALGILDGGPGVEQAEQALRRRLPVHARVQQRAHLAHGPEDLDPHHQHDEQHLDADGAVGDTGRRRPPAPPPRRRRCRHR